MIKIYGIIKKDGFIIGDNLQKHFIGEFSTERAVDILKVREKFIKGWNDNHHSEMVQIIFETEETQ